MALVFTDEVLASFRNWYSMTSGSLIAINGASSNQIDSSPIHNFEYSQVGMCRNSSCHHDTAGRQYIGLFGSWKKKPGRQSNRANTNVDTTCWNVSYNLFERTWGSRVFRYVEGQKAFSHLLSRDLPPTVTRLAQHAGKLSDQLCKVEIHLCIPSIHAWQR